MDVWDDLETAVAVSRRGPWFLASYDGECASCFDRIDEGDRIRADGDDGYLCSDCGDEE
jgi:hypothetical protein